jgi:tRNA 2-selenouridine synthase
MPLLDTRAPVEFKKGAFPNSINIPLMSDSERERVGTCYKQNGKQAAIELGESLVNGVTREKRIELWCEFARANPNGYLYCFRGGLRSQITQRWMQEAGIDFPRVLGGYKAMRRYLIDSLTQSIESSSFYLIAGKTGTGKTRAIEKINRAIDLEALAEHRGSSFGRLPTAQPRQINFENALAIAFLKASDSNDGSIFLEDESKMIGCISLPTTLYEKMKKAPLLIVEESLESRIQVILEDYIDDLGQLFLAVSPDQGKRLHKNHMLDALNRILKRLGSELHHELTGLMNNAFDSESCRTSDAGHALHRQWIELLLTQYYDPMYEYQINRREGALLARGNRDDIIETANRIDASSQ